MRVVVCGGRDCVGSRFVRTALDWIEARLIADGHTEGITLLAHGACRGADMIAGAWADDRGVRVEEFPADWLLGRRAGPLRNREMLRTVKPDLVVAFPGRRGTESLKSIARELGIEVFEVTMKLEAMQAGLERSDEARLESEL